MESGELLVLLPRPGPSDNLNRALEPGEPLPQPGTSDASERTDGRGGWRAALFIVAFGFFERIGFVGVSSNLIMYLTGRLGMSTATAAASVNAWSGTVQVLPLLGALAADSSLGRYRALLAAGLLYLLPVYFLTAPKTTKEQLKHFDKYGKKFIWAGDAELTGGKRKVYWKRVCRPMGKVGMSHGHHRQAPQFCTIALHGLRVPSSDQFHDHRGSSGIHGAPCPTAGSMVLCAPMAITRFMRRMLEHHPTQATSTLALMLLSSLSTMTAFLPCM